MRARSIVVFLPLWVVASLLADACAVSLAEDHPPVIAGLARDGLSPAVRGRVLLAELSCAACHLDPAAESPKDGDGSSRLERKTPPRLRDVGGRVSPEYLRRFIADPSRVKPGTTMPDVFGRRDDATRQSMAEDLTHYLVSLSEQRFRPNAPDRVAASHGERLFHEVGCVACHAPRDASGAEIATPGSVPLGDVHEKYSVSSLEAFLRDARAVRPSARMPDLLLSGVEAYRIANYLLRDTRVRAALRYTLYRGSVDWSRGERALDPAGIEIHRAGVSDRFDVAGLGESRLFAVRFEGFLDIRAEGRYEFFVRSKHAARVLIDGETLVAATGGEEASEARSLAAGLHEIEVLYSQRRGEPDLSITLAGPGFQRAPIPRTMLRAERDEVPVHETFRVDSDKAARGATWFRELRCSRCHEMDGPATPPARAALADLNVARGCLAPSGGENARYRLARDQIEDLRAALGSLRAERSEEDRVLETLVAMNCIACHARGEVGGVPDSRTEWFTSADEKLGEPGRVPPALTGVGAKLKLDWLRKTLDEGQAIRPYVKTRMPAFGRENVGHLAALFDTLDELPAAPFEAVPKGRDAERAVRDLGRQLVGDKGMRCITCHPFRGRGTSTMAAVDVIETTTERLRADWFYHYMLDPPRFRASTIMPQYFPEGVSIFRDLADGDPKKQLGAMWHYLSQGRNTRAPSGLVRPSMEITVGDEAVMLRRKAPDVGKRAISVGYPLGVNVVFDAETLSLRYVWWGKFIDPAGVWTGQGSGAVRVLSRERVRLGGATPFGTLANQESPWPLETAREIGIRFAGYRLGERRRPTFLYRWSDLSFEDAIVDRRGEAEGETEGEEGTDGVPILTRTIEIRGPDRPTLWFRVASNPEIESADGGVLVAKRLFIGVRRSRGEAALEPAEIVVRERRDAEDRVVHEAIVPTPIEGGRATLKLEYHSKGEAK